MIYWDIKAIAEQTFSTIPRRLRQYALQIQCVREGVKPACLMPIPVEELPVCLDYLGSLGLAIAVEQVLMGPTTFAQTGINTREKLIAEPRVIVYLARSSFDATRLARLNREQSYAALGIALGYPDCCVEAAVARDQLSKDEKSQVYRQANLNTIAEQVSTYADFCCNILLLESDLSGIAPLSAIAHYPCHFACPTSSGLGRLALECCVRVWPMWGITLSELLRSVIFYWSDATWSAEFWDESCGLALVSGRGTIDERSTTAYSSIPAIRLGSGKTPEGELPPLCMRIQVTKNHLLCQDSAGRLIDLPLAQIGAPVFIDWRMGTIHRQAR